MMLTPTRRTPAGRMYSWFADFCIRTQNISSENRVGIFILGMISGVSEITLAWMMLLILFIAVITSLITLLCIPRILLWLTVILMKTALPGQKLSWIVVDKNEKEAVLLAENALDVTIFGSQTVEWKDSNARRWCNRMFYAGAFTPEEKKEIIPTVHSGIEDMIFIPSHAEYVRYLGNGRLTDHDIGNAVPTAHVRRLLGGPEGTPVPWLLRSPAPNSQTEYVSEDGTVEFMTQKKKMSLRPAVRIII